MEELGLHLNTTTPSLCLQHIQFLRWEEPLLPPRSLSHRHARALLLLELNRCTDAQDTVLYAGQSAGKNMQRSYQKDDWAAHRKAQ